MNSEVADADNTPLSVSQGDRCWLARGSGSSSVAVELFWVLGLWFHIAQTRVRNPAGALANAMQWTYQLTPPIRWGRAWGMGTLPCKACTTVMIISVANQIIDATESLTHALKLTASSGHQQLAMA